MVMTAVVFVMSLAGAGPQVPPVPPPAVARPDGQGPMRDPARRPLPEPKGTAVIRGRVVSSDTGTPVRRATVNLSMVPPLTPVGPVTAAAATPPPTQAVVIRPKTATTDAQGGFEFTQLPAGSYRLSASPAQYSAAYLATSFGARRQIGRAHV